MYKCSIADADDILAARREGYQRARRRPDHLPPQQLGRHLQGAAHQGRNHSHATSASLDIKFPQSAKIVSIFRNPQP